MDLIATYNKYADNYEKHNFDTSIMLDFLEFFTGYKAGKRVLDVGCGPGRDAKYFVKNGFDVTGIDLTENFIKKAKNNVPQATFKLMDMRHLDFAKNSFDRLWASASFLHIRHEDAQSTLDGFSKVLKKDGLLYLGVKKGDGRTIIKNKRVFEGAAREFTLYRQKDLNLFLSKAGFQIIKQKTHKSRAQKHEFWINTFAYKI